MHAIFWLVQNGKMITLTLDLIYKFIKSCRISKYSDIIEYLDAIVISGLYCRMSGCKKEFVQSLHCENLM